MIGEDFPALLAAAQRGDQQAFSRLWRDANPALLRYLRVIAADAADDIAAETWVRVLSGLTSFLGDEQAWRAWLFTTCRRRWLDEGRRRSRNRSISIDEIPLAHLPQAADTADLAIEHLGTRSAMAMLTELPSLQAEVILLRVVAGLDTDTVARLVKRSPGAVRVAAHRGLRRLAQIASEAGVRL